MFKKTTVSPYRPVPSTTVLYMSSNRPKRNHTNNMNEDDRNDNDLIVSEQRSTTSIDPKSQVASTSKVHYPSKIGATELLLLQRAATASASSSNTEQEQIKVVQEYGCTIKNDGYDTIRSMIWFLFHMSNIIFPLLFLFFMINLSLNLFCEMGYYYNQNTHTFVIDTLDHIRFYSQIQL
jgi:hypothetical protein